ncbi:MAG TPA: hypothetical protein DDY88_07200 [Actinobacteria bacterium]|nr:hypothetical protein [Actinomycetota bacterium]
MSAGYDLPIRSQPHPVSIADRLPRTKDGGDLIPGIDCPRCHDLSLPAADHVPAHGLQVSHSPWRGGCGAELVWSVTDDGIALVTPEAWSKQHGGAPPFTYAATVIQRLAMQLKSAEEAMRSTTTAIGKLNIAFEADPQTPTYLQRFLNREPKP